MKKEEFAGTRNETRNVGQMPEREKVENRTNSGSDF